MNTRLDSGAELNIRCVGDSFMSGGGPAATVTAWPELLARLSVLGRELTVESTARAMATIDNVGRLRNGRLHGEPQRGTARYQLADLRPGKYALVIVSVGGNDAGFRALLRRTSRLGRTISENEIEARIRVIEPLLVRCYEAVRQQARGACVAALLYPDLTSKDRRVQRHAPLLTRMGWDVRGQRLIRFAANTFDEIAKRAARNAGIHVIDPRSTFAPHAIGSAQPWISGFPAQRECGALGGAFHLNAAGHEAMAYVVQKWLVEALENDGPKTEHGLPVNPPPSGLA